MAKRKTNVQIVKSVMEFSAFGPLAQAFVVQAITKYAEAVANAKPEDVDNAMISGESWVGVAKEIRDKMAEAYK